MKLADIENLVGAVAPTIATALGGPLAGLAVKTLSNLLLGHGNGTDEDVATALSNATPDQLAAIKKIDADFKVQMKSLDIDLDRIAADDRESARQMKMMTKDWTPDVLSFVVIIAWACIQFYMFSHVIDLGMRELIARVLGTLDGALMLVLSFWFGSSAGSRAKDIAEANKDQK